MTDFLQAFGVKRKMDDFDKKKKPKKQSSTSLTFVQKTPPPLVSDTHLQKIRNPKAKCQADISVPQCALSLFLYF